MLVVECVLDCGCVVSVLLCFFFNDTATTEIYTLSLHDALPIYSLVTYGAALGDGATHQFYDLPMIVAGGGQGQVKIGRAHV